MTLSLSRVAAAVAAVALLIPAAAHAKPGNGLALGHQKKAAPAPHAVEAPAAADATETVDSAVTDARTVAAPAPARSRTVAGRAKGRAKPKLFVFRGSVTGIDALAGTVDVAVRGGNAVSRRFRGEVVTFSLADAIVEGVETDGLAGLTIGDVLVSDRVLVQARLPRTTAPDGTTLAARKLVDQAEREPVEVVEPTEPEQTEGESTGDEGGDSLEGGGDEPAPPVE